MSRNRLADETSPYLLQHKDNPVHWWAWGPEALAEAQKTGKPILLSVGYAACHWCHVMAHESFEDAPTADVMNDLFINIKVDREERPDIDAIYMGALHKLGEQGGWPLTMFLDTSARPFFGGTYFPKEQRYGRPSFVDVLRNVSRIFHDEPEKVAHNADVITSEIGRQATGGNSNLITDEMIADLTSRMVRAVDPDKGGITGAPKFPQWSFFWLMWRGAIRYDNAEARRAVETTLSNICQGGIYDHLGGGFARYSVDERWLAPHFEKMLYDNALLVDLLTHAWRETKTPLYEARITETVAWLDREMIAEGGGFAASLDADSEGEEGRFYVWSSKEIEDVLGPDDAVYFAQAYDVSPAGNWEGHNILNRLAELNLRRNPEETRLENLREKLLAHRETRIRPGWDDKVLADWNGLMIAALARASTVFNRPDWLELCRTAFRFVEQSMIRDGRMHHSWRAGRLGALATSSDYANMIWAALRMYEATTESGYLATAQTWTDTLHSHHWMTDLGRFATTADDVTDVIVRLASGTDDAVPNANAIMVSNLSHLAILTGDDRHHEQAAMILDSLSGQAGQNLIAYTGLLAGAMDVLEPQQVVLFLGEAEIDHASSPDLQSALHSLSLPGAIECIVAGGSKSSISTPALDGKGTIGKNAAAYVCVGPQCSLPQTDATEFSELLKQHRVWKPKTQA